MDNIGILIIDNDTGSQSALRQVLDSEGWFVHISPLANQAMQDLASGDWALVIVNVAMTGLSGPLYTTLKELALASPMESSTKRLRVLFLVPEGIAPQARSVLENERLPYILKPFNLHDFLERVSDLLMETSAIPEPIRRVRPEGKGAGHRGIWTSREDSAGQASSRNTGMFAKREDYTMTEEEISEYERQETAETQLRKKKKNPSLD